MFVELSKILDLAVSPIVWSLALLAAALLARRRAGAASALVAAAALVLWAFSTGTVSNALASAVESSAPSTFRPGVTYDAVIVLSGMVDEHASHRSGRPELTGAADRIVAGFELLREGRARAVLLSGGSPRLAAGERSEPELLASALRTWGIDPSRIVVEDRSRNTHENAVEAARVVRERGWRTVVLVTSAAHMPRALGSFQNAGLRPDALPVDRRASRGPHRSWTPRARALFESTEALRELLGRLVYWAMGYT